MEQSTQMNPKPSFFIRCLQQCEDTVNWTQYGTCSKIKRGTRSKMAEEFLMLLKLYLLQSDKSNTMEPFNDLKQWTGVFICLDSYLTYLKYVKSTTWTMDNYITQAEHLKNVHRLCHLLDPTYSQHQLSLRNPNGTHISLQFLQDWRRFLYYFENVTRVGFKLLLSRKKGDLSSRRSMCIDILRGYIDNCNDCKDVDYRVANMDLDSD